MGLPHGVSPNPFMYIFNFPCTYTIIFVKYSSITNFVRLFSFTCLYADSIGIKRGIIPGETSLKTNGPPLRCKSQPSYVHIHFLAHKYPFVYIFIPLYTFKLVNNQVTLALNARFIHLFIFPS